MNNDKVLKERDSYSDIQLEKCFKILHWKITIYRVIGKEINCLIRVVKSVEQVLSQRQIMSERAATRDRPPGQRAVLYLQRFIVIKIMYHRADAAAQCT